MKAHYLTVKEERIARAAAERIAEQQCDDIAKRAQLLWMVAMLKSGYESEDVNKVSAILPKVIDQYAEYRTEQIADYVFQKRLTEVGVKVDPVSVEL